MMEHLSDHHAQQRGRREEMSQKGRKEIREGYSNRRNGDRVVKYAGVPPPEL